MSIQKSKKSAALSAGVLLAVSGASNARSDTIVEREVGPVSGKSVDVLFTPVSAATDLVSISAGSVETGEGGTLTISAITVYDQTVEVYSDAFPAFFSSRPLDSLTSNDFSAFPEVDVKGLRFSVTTAVSAWPTSMTLPAATVLAFVAVPEPSTALLLCLGLAALSGRRLLDRFRS